MSRPLMEMSIVKTTIDGYNIIYDDYSDVLYVKERGKISDRGKPFEDDFIILRRNSQTGETVGLTLIDFCKLYRSNYFNDKKLPSPFSIALIDKIASRLDRGK